MSNRLASEHSPYLLQHQDNPVDWYPWGDDAFARARAENKPIFLSIGYSTCHWCHVMAHESFENADVAARLTRDFVSIKVDREERPDVDRVYMTFVQSTTGSGGWPMSVWLTPALEPFHGGTYFPPTSRWGRPGFIEVLDEIARVWRDEQEQVLRSAARIVEHLRTINVSTGGDAVPGTEALARAVREFEHAFDHRRGGFGKAPKFPRPSELLFLLREHVRTGVAAPREMALATLRAMALGGMRDHVGGGFHRYSVDADWRVPHFEKMLYDQAQLLLAYVDAAQLTGDPFFAEVARDTIDYVSRDMTAPFGAFYSAEDADSVPPEHVGEPDPHPTEGAFYLWTAAEIRRVLGADADVFIARFGILDAGNAPADPQEEFTGKNLLYVARALEDVAAETGRGVDDVQGALASARELARVRRDRRPRPHLDDKVLTAWNGLMIAALAKAGRVLDDGEPYVRRAATAAAFLRAHMWNAETGVLLRRYRQGHASVEGYAEDYAYLIFGLLELFQADGDVAWLEWAVTLQARQHALFWDADGAGWFNTTGKDASVLLRLKEDYDGAEPSATSVTLLNLLTLSHLTETPSHAAGGDDVTRTFTAFAERAATLGRAVPMLMAALSTYHAGTVQIVIVGDPVDAEVRAMRDIVRARYRPSALQILVTPENRAAVTARIPWIVGMTARGPATAYVCRQRACQTPVTTAKELGVQLDAL